MADTYTLLEKITVGAAGASSVEFTSIPQTYTDLKIVISSRGNASAMGSNLGISFNGSTSSFTGRYLEGTGSAAASASVARFISSTNANTSTASTFGNAEIYIPNYTGSTNKSFSAEGLSENNATEAYMHLTAGLWSNTAAITSITISLLTSDSFMQYSTFYLYGIAKEGVNPSLPSAPYATGGDSILFDGTYWIHTFTSSGTFTPKKALTCDYLVVAGGGGGAGTGNGVNQAFPGGNGGGAGGLRCTVGATGGGGSLESPLSLTAQAYTVTIGAGGTGTLGALNTSTNGSNSVFSTITATGGGGTISYNPQTGGSGAGGNANGTTTNGAAGTANQGYAGGAGTGATGFGSGGGGGAGAVGATTTNNNGGNGGAGVTTSISGTSVTYAGGGGGGAYGFAGGAGSSGGSGGGGAGASGNNNGGAGTANRGGGGGGASQTGLNQTTGGNGGSGIVIVRYAA